MKKIVLFVIAAIFCIPFITQGQSCGTINVAKNRPVKVSGEKPFHVGADAVDGNMTSSWFVTADTSYISVDLGQSLSVCKIKISWTSNGRGKNYKAQVSTDEENWSDIFTRTNNTADTDSFTTLNTPGRYVRIYTTSRVNTWSSLEMYELEIYNSLDGNVKPSVSLTAPANGATFFSETNVTLTATASDPDGSLAKVEFYQGAVKLGEATNAPYTFVWSNVQAGNYSLTARAFDNNNADSTSAPINITVNPTSRWSLQGNAGTTPDASFLGTTDNKKLVFKTNNQKRMSILTNGFVGIGIDSLPYAEAKLGVNGAIYAKKLKVTQSGWADYVFEKDYKLPSLAEVENHINKYKHLPGVPSAAEVQQNGTDVAEIQATLLKKIEELTLYIIAQNKMLERQQEQINELKRKAERN